MGNDGIQGAATESQGEERGATHGSGRTAHVPRSLPPVPRLNHELSR
jgi:hypothetical protein